MKGVLEKPDQAKTAEIEKDTELEPQKTEAFKDVTDEELEQFIASAESLINQQTAEVLPEAEQKIKSSAESINVSDEMIQTVRQEQRLDQQFSEVQSEADQIATEAQSDINAVIESKEEYPENIVEQVVDITPEVRENIELIKMTLDKDLQVIKQYEELLTKRGGFGSAEEFQKALYELMPNYPALLLMDKFKFINHVEHIPSTGKRVASKYKEIYRDVKYLPETIEAAYLANDKKFSADLKELASRIKNHGLLSDYGDKAFIADVTKWNNFLELFNEIPRGDKNKIKKWLLSPSSRVSHSIFTHVTSEFALDNILSSRSLKSSSLISDPSQTGAWSSSLESTPLERKAIYFDQNSVSRGYGISNREYKKLNFDKLPRKIWFITRGDQLLKFGVVDRESFEGRHPFVDEHNEFGSKFLIPGQEGAEISLDKFLILIPDEASDMEQKIRQLYPDATIKTYDKAFYSLGDDRKKLDIGVMQSLSHELKDKFGFVETPEMVISCLNSKEQKDGDGGKYSAMSFPVTSHVQSLETTPPEKAQESEK